MKMSEDEIVKCFSRHGDHDQRNLIHQHLSNYSFQQDCLSICGGSHSVSIKRWAHEACAMMSGRDFSSITRVGLSSPAMSIRLHTVIGIGSGINRGRIDWLFDLLNDESGGIRLNVLEILIGLRPKKVRQYLPVMLNDNKKYIRSVAEKCQKRGASQ